VSGSPRSDLAAVGFKRRFHVITHVFEALPIGFRPFGVRIKKVVADIGTRYINIGANIVQNVVLSEIAASDLVVAVPKLLEHP
jgi:hypothetical protein